MSSGHIAHVAHQLVDAANKTIEEKLPAELAEIVKEHSGGAALACVAAGWLPGAGGLAAVGICAAFVWTMYGRINSRIGLPLADNVVKSIATGVATNLATGFIGALFVQTVLTIIPGLGNLGAAALAGATGYALTMASGYVYMKVLTNLFLSGEDPCLMDEKRLKDAATQIATSNGMKTIIKEARAEYKPA